MMLLILLACTEGTPNTGLILTGWNYGWENLSHRVSYLNVGIEADSTLDLGFIGGPYSSGVAGDDTPLYRTRFERVSSPDLWVVDGELEIEVDPTGKAQGTALIETPAELKNTVALIRGFEIDTNIEQGSDYPLDVYDPSYGYTTSGFGITLGTPVLSAGGAELPINVEIRWREQDRDDMNAAIPYAHTRMIVRYSLVSFDGKLETTDISNTTTYDVENPDTTVWVYTDQPPVELPIEINGRPSGFVGWTSFDMGVNTTGKYAGEGDYVRALGLEAIPTETDASLWAGTITSTIQTTSVIELTVLTATTTATLARIGVKDAVVEHFVAEGSHPVGPAQTDPLL